MANIITHRFHSGKTDGPDATQIQPSAWNDGHAFAGGNAGDLLTRDPTDATYGAKWAPPAAIGQWVDVPYSAANFHASGSMIWTVDPGDQVTFAYVLDGHRMVIAFEFYPTSIGGTADAYLMFAVPGGHVPTRGMEAIGFYYQTLAGPPVGTMRIAANVGDTAIYLSLVTGGNWTIGVNASYLYGQITISI